MPDCNFFSPRFGIGDIEVHIVDYSRYEQEQYNKAEYHYFLSAFSLKTEPSIICIGEIEFVKPDEHGLFLSRILVALIEFAGHFGYLFFQQCDIGSVRCFEECHYRAR